MPSAIPKVSRCDGGGKMYVISGVMPLENVQVETDAVVTGEDGVHGKMK